MGELTSFQSGEAQSAASDPVTARRTDSAQALKPGPIKSWNRERALAQAALLLSIDGSNALVTSAALCFVLAACCVCLRLGLPHTSMYGHDVFILLDGGWRVLNGQRPHIDFYSAFGPVTYLIAAAGLWFSTAGVEGIMYATVAVGAVLGIWSALIGRTRLKAWPSLLFVSFIVLFWLAPFPIGEPYYLPSYAMQYNRLGYSLLAIALVESSAAARSPGGQHSLDWGRISTGVILALLLFLKISFFVVGIFLVGALFLLLRRSLRGMLSLLAGFLFVSLLFVFYLHWNISAMWTDLSIAAHARTARFHASGDPVRTIARNIVEITALAGFAGLARLFSVPGSSQRRSWKLVTLVCFVFVILAADLLLAIGNTQRSGFPLTVVAVLLLADLSCSNFELITAPFRDLFLHRSIIVSFAALLVLLPTMSDTVNGWGVVLMRSVTSRSLTQPAAVADSPTLQAMKFDDHADPAADPAAHNGAALVKTVEEGLSLIRSHSTQDESVECLCFSNPFSYALMRRSAIGGSTFFSYGTNFTDRIAPPATRILGDAELVIYPTSTGDEAVGPLLHICGSRLIRDYRLLATSEHWTLLRKIH